MLAQREKEQYENQRKTFDKLATNLHHLMSTKSIPGIYNSPYILDENKPQVFGANVEEHLKTNVKYNMLTNNRLQSTFNSITQGKVDLNDYKKKIAMKETMSLKESIKKRGVIS